MNTAWTQAGRAAGLGTEVVIVVIQKRRRGGRSASHDDDRELRAHSPGRVCLGAFARSQNGAYDENDAERPLSCLTACSNPERASGPRYYRRGVCPCVASDRSAKAWSA